MKIISSFLLTAFLLLPVALPPEARAGSCGSKSCPLTYVTPYVPPPPAATSASHAFTAIGGTRVAEINLSPEGRVAINAAGKEEPLPKGFSTTPDRAKIVARQTPLYGWPQNEIARPVPRTQSHYLTVTREQKNARGRVARSSARSVKRVTAIKVASAAKAKPLN